MKILILDNFKKLNQEQIKEIFLDHTLEFGNDLLENASAKINVLKPDITLLIGYQDQVDYFKQLELLKRNSRTFLIPEFISPSSDTLIRLMQMGFTDILLGHELGKIEESILRAQQGFKVKSSQFGKAVCLAFMSAKGGDGGTCLAANFAAGLASKTEDARVLAIDLSLPFGDFEMYLTNQKIKNDLSDIAGEYDRLDNSLLDSMVEKITDNLHLISSPRSFDKVLSITPGQVDQLIKLAITSYDYIIFDIGAGIDPISVQILEKLDHLYIVTTLTVPSVRRSGQLLNLWDTLGYSQDKISVVINRHNEVSELQVKDLERVINRPVLKILPYDPEGIQDSLLKGQTLLQINPKSAFSKIITGWLDEYLGTSNIFSKEKSSLWHRLRNK